MEVTLQPVIKVQPRLIALGILLLPILLVPRMPWYIRLMACFLPLALTGTYRISTIQGDKFRSQLFFAFIKLKPAKCNLQGVVYVETKFNDTTAGWGTFLLFGPLQYVFGIVFDMILPALGGAYEIWLITAKDREIVA